MIAAEPSAFDISDSKHVLNKMGLLKPPRGTEATKCTNYLKKLMEECGKRLV